jgi:hypothetical protein
MNILRVTEGRLHANVVGRTPIILNRMTEKAMRELLMPKGRKNAAERASTLKHNPIEEFRASPYTDRDPDGPTYITHLATAFKKAMANAAKDIPGATKAEVGRLTWVVGERIAIYGIPMLHMSVVRQAGMNKTPDIRTRAIIPKWACRIEVAFVQEILKPAAIGDLIVTAGMTQGIGDWRTEKGSGTYGQFSLVDDDDEEFRQIIATGGRAAQIAAMENPVPYDQEAEELLAWFQSELEHRTTRNTIPTKNGKNGTRKVTSAEAT